MPRKPKTAPDDPEQLKRFKEMAREVAVEETEGAFDKAFTKVLPRLKKDHQVVPKED
jgi:hypothetical protein